ncbi:efflux transporter outer membrane subunit [bacterium]|nr:efflux transporter outer membrane subunit [bacterium]
MKAFLLMLFLSAALWAQDKEDEVKLENSVVVPPQFRDTPVTDRSIGDLRWFEIFKDPQLQALLRTAIANNLDLRLAVARVDAARGNAGIQDANLYPKLSLQADLNQTLASKNSPTFPAGGFLPRNRPYFEVLLNFLSYELDLWGRVHHQSQAAWDEVLASEENRRAVLTTVVSEVASNYFNLLELDAELDIAQRTLKTRTDSLELIRARQQGGVASMLEVRQGEQLVQTAQIVVSDAQRQIAQMENQISILLGTTPGPVARGKSLLEQEPLPEVPAGLPSQLLTRRPDIRAAEFVVLAREEQIKVAYASLFPRITLTGFLGFQSKALHSLFQPDSGTFFLNPTINQPVFDASLGSAEDYAIGNRNIALVQYQQTVATAFKEVSDSLIDHTKYQEIRKQREELVVTLKDRSELSYLRYTGGVDSLLNALDADRDLFQAEVALAQARRGELISLVQLYKALGGGWQPEQGPAPVRVEDESD